MSRAKLSDSVKLRVPFDDYKATERVLRFLPSMVHII